MNRIVVEQHVGEDGLLEMNARLGADQAGREATSVWAGVVAAADEVGGRYCENCHVGVIVPDDRKINAGSEGVRGYALDTERAKSLWTKSEQMLGERF